MPGFQIGQGTGPSNTVETLRQHRWLIQTLGPIAIGPDAGGTPPLLAESLQLPNVIIEEQTIQAALIKYKFAKSVSWEDASVTFYDTDNLLSKLLDWRNLVYTNVAGIKEHGGANGYKKDSIFKLLDGIGKEKVTLTLRHSWPKSISHGPLSYGSTDIKLITVTLSYDFAIGPGD